jgi:hypothetical protein
MSDFGNGIVGRKRRPWVLGGMALAAALTIAAPGRADTAEDLNDAELNRLAIATPAQPAMPNAPQPAMLTASEAPGDLPQGYVYPADVDCNDAYYDQYCQAYAAWLAQYYAAYGYAYPYDDYGYYAYGYPADVVIGFGVFRGHRFHNFHHFAFVHGMRFHGTGFHGGFHGGGFHGGGSHGGGGHR